MAPQDNPWSVPVHVEDIPAEGRRLTLEADTSVRTAIARAAGLVELPRLQAELQVRRQEPDGARVQGIVSATVVQTCVVTLEPVTNQVQEALDVSFVPAAAIGVNPPGHDVGTDEPDPPEPLTDGIVDLGALAVEFLLLGLDPYPRKPDAVFAVPAGGEDADSPFAALAALNKSSRKRD